MEQVSGARPGLELDQVGQLQEATQFLDTSPEEGWLRAVATGQPGLALLPRLPQGLRRSCFPTQEGLGSGRGRGG